MQQQVTVLEAEISIADTHVEAGSYKPAISKFWLVQELAASLLCTMSYRAVHIPVNH
jgi:hypothetical protein